MKLSFEDWWESWTPPVDTRERWRRIAEADDNVMEPAVYAAARAAWEAALAQQTQPSDHDGPCNCFLPNGGHVETCWKRKSQQAHPLTDDAIELRVSEYVHKTGGVVQYRDLIEMARWARDRMAQQAQPLTDDHSACELCAKHPDARGTQHDPQEAQHVDPFAVCKCGRYTIRDVAAVTVGGREHNLLYCAEEGGDPNAGQHHPNTPGEPPVLTDEMIEAEAYSDPTVWPPAFIKGAKWARDYRSPMPSREQIARALHDFVKIGEEPEDTDESLHAADAVLGLFKRHEAMVNLTNVDSQ